MAVGSPWTFHSKVKTISVELAYFVAQKHGVCGHMMIMLVGPFWTMVINIDLLPSGLYDLKFVVTWP